MTIASRTDIMSSIAMFSDDKMNDPEFRIMTRNICADLLHIKHVYRFDWRDLVRLNTLLDRTDWTDMERRAINATYLGLERLCGHDDRDDRYLFTSADSLLQSLLPGFEGPLSETDKEFLEKVSHWRLGVYHLKDGMSVERLADVAREAYGWQVKVRL